MNYRIISAHEVESLIKQANALWEKGWRPVGGIAVAVMPRLGHEPSQRTFYQAVINEPVYP